jgi:hypothetical protein
MPMTKLTLSADRELIKQAKKLAKREGTSLSSMFARYLEAILKRHRRETEKRPPGPLTRKATGLARVPAGKTDRQLLEDALAERYGLSR